MTYLNCRLCRLSIEQRRGRPELEYCPRCLAKFRRAVPLFRSPLPWRLLDGSGEESVGPGLPSARAAEGAG